MHPLLKTGSMFSSSLDHGSFKTIIIGLGHVKAFTVGIRGSLCAQLTTSIETADNILTIVFTLHHFHFFHYFRKLNAFKGKFLLCV